MGFPKQIIVDVVDNGYKVRLRVASDRMEVLVFRFEDKKLLFEKMRGYLNE